MAMMNQMQMGMMNRMQMGMGSNGGNAVRKRSSNSAAVAPAPAPESRWSIWNEPDRVVGVGYQIGTITLVSSDAFRQIGHSLVTILLAALGGLYARSRYASWTARDMPEGNPNQAVVVSSDRLHAGRL